MKNKVRRTLALMSVSIALFMISEWLASPQNEGLMNWVRGAAAGLALAGIFGFILIISEVLKAKK